MKTLFIVRHAKSSWEHPGQVDFERPLNDRGQRDAPEMGKRLNALNIVPSHIISSPAKRAITTARIIAGILGIFEIEQVPGIYHASESKLLEIIKCLPGNYSNVMLFGHNTGLTDLVNSLSGSSIPNVPTCGVAGIRFDVDAWEQVEFGNGKLFLFDFPKNKTP